MFKDLVLEKVQAKKQEVMNSFDALVQEINELPADEDPSEQVAQLQAQVVELQNVVAEKEGVILSQKDLLAQADQLAKSIDAAIPDA